MLVLTLLEKGGLNHIIFRTIKIYLVIIKKMARYHQVNEG